MKQTVLILSIYFKIHIGSYGGHIHKSDSQK